MTMHLAPGINGGSSIPATSDSYGHPIGAMWNNSLHTYDYAGTYSYVDEVNYAQNVSDSFHKYAAKWTLTA
jgi:hypothetical protein